MFGVWCEVWGGVTGSREAWAKSGSCITIFDTMEQAEEYAKELTALISMHSQANFRYTAKAL
jgi:hypothetical protein